jgi:hypothetical protein
MESVYSSETLVTIYQTVRCYHPEDHCIYVGKTVLESTSTPVEILVNHVPSLQLGSKTNAYQVLSCQTLTRPFITGVQVLVTVHDNPSTYSQRTV